jgi:hypothetical protein
MSLFLDLRLMAATLFKAAKAGPRVLRRLFFLPTRDSVADAFYSRIVPPPSAAVAAVVLQPA